MGMQSMFSPFDPDTSGWDKIKKKPKKFSAGIGMLPKNTIQPLGNQSYKTFNYAGGDTPKGTTVGQDANGNEVYNAPDPTDPNVMAKY